MQSRACSVTQTFNIAILRVALGPVPIPTSPREYSVKASYVPVPCWSCRIDRKNKKALPIRDWQSVWGDKIYTNSSHGF